MTTTARRILPALLLLAGACAAPRPAAQHPATAPAPPPPAQTFPHAVVWTREAGTTLRADSIAAGGVVPHLFTRLEVLGADSARLHVRCVVCDPRVEGWVPQGAVVYDAGAPETAARGELAEFLLAVRAAAERADVAALRPVMSRRFTSSFGGGDGVLEAVARWEREGHRSLRRLPGLLDRGVATRDQRIWAAPPEHLSQPQYYDLRAGFRREAGRWEWIFLVRGD